MVWLVVVWWFVRICFDELFVCRYCVVVSLCCWFRYWWVLVVILLFVFWLDFVVCDLFLLSI